MSNEQVDLRTPLQKKRDKRNKEIYQLYTDYVDSLPQGTAKWSIFRTIAEQYGMKPQGIRSVIEKEKMKHLPNKEH